MPCLEACLYCCKGSGAFAHLTPAWRAELEELRCMSQVALFESVQYLFKKIFEPRGKIIQPTLKISHPVAVGKPGEQGADYEMDPEKDALSLA